MEARKSLGQVTLENCYSKTQIQCLEGPLSILEKVFTKIWLKKDCLKGNLKTQSDRSLRIIDPGCWNLLEGPDFNDVILKIDNKTINRDVKIHFEESNWFQHGHEQKS